MDKRTPSKPLVEKMNIDSSQRWVQHPQVIDGYLHGKRTGESRRDYNCQETPHQWGPCWGCWPHSYTRVLPWCTEGSVGPARVLCVQQHGLYVSSKPSLTTALPNITLHYCSCSLSFSSYWNIASRPGRSCSNSPDFWHWQNYCKEWLSTDVHAYYADSFNCIVKTPLFTKLDTFEDIFIKERKVKAR